MDHHSEGAPRDERAREARVVGPFRCLGVTWSLRSDDPAVAQAVVTLYASCAAPGAEPTRAFDVWVGARGTVSLAVNGSTVLTDVDPGHALAHLAWEVNQAVIASPGDRLLLHAAAAEHDGSAVVLAGPHGSGKSTLVTALVRAGMRYVTDDVVALDLATGRVDPYPKPIGLKPGSWPEFPDVAQIADDSAARAVGEWLVAPHQLRDGAVAHSGGVMEVLVFPAYRPESPLKIVPLTSAEAVVGLAGAVLNLASLGPGVLGRMAAVCRSTRRYALTFSDLEVARDGIVRLVRGDEVEPEVPVAPVAGSWATEPGGEPALDTGAPRRVDVEWIALDGEVVALDPARGRVHHLNASCAAVWLACDGRTSVAEIAARIGRSYGIVDAYADVTAAVRSMLDAGLLELGDPV